MDIAEEVRSLTLDLRAFSPSRAEPATCETVSEASVKVGLDALVIDQ